MTNIVPTALLLTFAAFAPIACRRGAPMPADSRSQAMNPIDPPPDAPLPTPPSTATVVHSAYGGQGPVPANAGPDDYIRTITVIDIDVRSTVDSVAPSIDRIDYFDANGNVLASMRSVIELRRIPVISPATNGWNALSAPSVPMAHTLSPGISRIRIEAWLTRHPAVQPSRVHVVVHTTGRIEADGAVAGEWPTA